MTSPEPALNKRARCCEWCSEPFPTRDKGGKPRRARDDEMTDGEMDLLPKQEWTIHMEAADSVILGAWEYLGARAYKKFLLIDLPNDLLSLNDLEGLVVDRHHRGSIL